MRAALALASVALLFALGVWLWRGHARDAEAARARSSVSVTFLGRGPGVRFRVCNNGYQPVRHVVFTAGASTFTADTTLAQAHCADLGWEGEYPGLDSASAVVTEVERE